MYRTGITQRFWSQKMDIHFHASFNQKMTTAASDVRCNKCLNKPPPDSGTLAHPTKCTNKRGTAYSKPFHTHYNIPFHLTRFYCDSLLLCQHEEEGNIMGCWNMPVQCECTTSHKSPSIPQSVVLTARISPKMAWNTTKWCFAMKNKWFFHVIFHKHQSRYGECMLDGRTQKKKEDM